MKIGIIYEHSKPNLKNALLYLFPNKEDEITHIINIIILNNSIILNNGDISYENCNSPIFDERRLVLNETEFINYVYLLKRCKNAVVVKINNIHNYTELTTFNKQLNYRLILHENTNGLYNKSYVNAIVVDNEMHIITIDICDAFFNNIKTVEIEQFIRATKLSKIL